MSARIATLALALVAWGQALAQAPVPLTGDAGSSAGRGGGTRAILFRSGWYLAFFIDGGEVVYRASADGVTFTAPSPASAGIRAELGFSMANAGDRVALVWGTQAAAGYQLWYREGTIAGPSISWRGAQLVSAGAADLRGSFPLVAFDSNGVPVLNAFHQREGYAGPLPVPFSGPPAQLAFTNPERQVVAGRCSEALVVSLLDANGVPAVAAASATVTLSSALALPDAGILFFPDAGCGWPPSERGDIPAGGSAATFTLMGTAAGRYPLTASAPGLASATQELELVPDVPAMVQFTSGPFTVDAGECSPPVTFHLVDWYGNLSPPDAGMELFAFASTGTVSLYSDPGCTEPLASVIIAPPDAGGVVHFQSFVPQRFALSLGAVGFAGGFQQEIIYGEHVTVTLTLNGPTPFAGSEQRIEVLLSNLGPDTLAGARLRLEVDGLSLSDPGPIPLPAIPFQGTAQLGRPAVVTGAVGSTFRVRGQVENAAGEPIGPENEIRRVVFPMVANLGSSCGGCAAGGMGPWAAAAALTLALLLRRRRA